MNALEPAPGFVTFWRYVFLAILIASISFGALGLIGLIIVGEFDDWLGGACLLTTVTWLFASSAGLACVTAMHRNRLMQLMQVTVLCVLLSALYWTAAAWTEGFHRFRAQEDHLRIAGTLTLATVGLVISGQIFAAAVASPFLRVSRWPVVANLDLFLLTMIMLMWGWFDHVGEGPIIGISFGWGIVSVVLVICWAALVRTMVRSARKRESESIPQRFSLHLTCPKCSHEQTLPGGLTRCQACRFAMLIEVEEPRCECGYLLFKLQGDVCPECGRQIASPPELQRVDVAVP